MSGAIPSTRDRIVSAAAKLFYREGIRAVSVDAVAEKAGITKRTLYYHFESKDDLIAAYLSMRDNPNLAQFQNWFSKAEGDVADKVQGVFLALAQAARHPRWKGCGFLRTAAELANMPGHPAIKAGVAHKKRVEDWFTDVLENADVGDQARQLARQLILLLDGALTVVLLQRDPSYMETAGQAARLLIRMSLPKPEDRCLS